MLERKWGLQAVTSKAAPRYFPDAAVKVYVRHSIFIRLTRAAIRSVLFLSLVLLALAFGGCISHRQVYAQSGGAQAQNSPGNPVPAATQQANSAAGAQQVLHAGTNLVLVRVIVRDAAGNPVANLRADDFRLFDEKFDKNNQQVITAFTVESSSGAAPSAKPAEIANAAGVSPAASAVPASSVPAAAPRYLALFFDDVHLQSDELGRARKAAEQYISQFLSPGDRVGVFDSSGKGMLDFTDDRGKLRDALKALRSRPAPSLGAGSCPPFDEYQAGLVVNNESDAVDVATQEVLHCYYNDDPDLIMQAKLYVAGQADSIVNVNRKQDENSLQELDELVRRMSGLTGPRSIVLVSPGFLADGLDSAVSAVIDAALRVGVIISALDAGGIHTAASLADPNDNMTSGQAQVALREAAEQVKSHVMADLAAGTGGVFFHNNNDLNRGLRLTSALPETAYLLGFTPSSRQLDGTFHTLKVTLAAPGKFTVQARRGYFAGKGSAGSGPAQQ